MSRSGSVIQVGLEQWAGKLGGNISASLGRCALGRLTGMILESRMPRFPLESGW
jgi:hypothetical protein